MKNACLQSMLLCGAVLFGLVCQAADQPAGKPESGEKAKEPLEKPAEHGLRRYLEKTISKANQVAACLDGKTFVEHCSFERAIYFVPRREPPKLKTKVEQRKGKTVIVMTLPPDPPPLELPELTYDGKPGPLPKDCVERTWVDDYCLAQQYSYRLKLLDIGAVVDDEKSKGPAADVRVKLIVKRRTGIAAKEKPVPKPGEGQQVWYPFFRRALARQYGGSCVARELEGIQMPDEAKPEVKGDLAEKAVEKMLAGPEKRLETTLTLRALYWQKAGLWYVRGYTSDLPKSMGPARLWKMEIPRGKGVQTLRFFDPKRHSQRDRDDQKAANGDQPQHPPAPRQPGG